MREWTGDSAGQGSRDVDIRDSAKVRDIVGLVQIGLY